MHLGRTLLAALGIAAVSLASPAHADPVKLFSTGVDEDGAILATGLPDPHWTIATLHQGSPPPTTPFPFPELGALLGSDLAAYATDGIPGAWVPNDALSKWIAPSVDTSGEFMGIYTYRATFDLHAFDPATVRIAGSWSADDGGWMFLNGLLVSELPFGGAFEQLHGVQVVPNFQEFSYDHDFVLRAGFLPGVNTVEFVAWNTGGGPTGLRVEITSATACPPRSRAPGCRP